MMLKYINILIIIIAFIYKSKILHKRPLLLVAVISCNRYSYLNRTLHAFIKHINYYEKKIRNSIIFLDQGTVQRTDIVNIFNIHNIVFMNPIGYSASFNFIFSYLYTKYTLFLEEDWEVVNNIETKIIHPSFIREAIKILDKVNIVYGILLRNTRDICVNYSLIIHTSMGKHILFVLKPPIGRSTFTNGASIYRSIDLKKLDYYYDETNASQFFRYKNYKLGFTYKGLLGKWNSTNCQYVMKHIGKRSTSSGICRVWLY